ncbi:hypothetical protein EZS27_018662 [termite gut metagenome]|uniref:Uncharacterized protein n=1 Tax=termite gut metagenome TaxID=433724 RepID=A0A5J4RI71_9ZZZZ
MKVENIKIIPFSPAKVYYNINKQGRKEVEK